ncbi:MAG: DivIVA domain-containing protein, partial [Nocardioidaceae bacterium]
MPLTPEDVRSKRFTPVRLREGYDMGEVDQFLDEVEAELERLYKENNDLRTKLESAQSGVATSAPKAPEATAPIPTPQPAPTPPPPPPPPPPA